MLVLESILKRAMEYNIHNQVFIMYGHLELWKNCCVLVTLERAVLPVTPGLT